jgi:hypothetical protein
VVGVVGADDVRWIALSLPHSDGFDFRVGNCGFVWSYPEYVPGQRRVIRTDIAVLYVGDEAEKQALLLSEPEVFFTTSAYDWSPLVMVRLEGIDIARLRELVTDAWHMWAPADLKVENPLVCGGATDELRVIVGSTETAPQALPASSRRRYRQCRRPFRLDTTRSRWNGCQSPVGLWHTIRASAADLAGPTLIRRTSKSDPNCRLQGVGCGRPDSYRGGV